MSEEPSNEPRSACGWVKLFHPSGALVTLPVPGVPFDYTAALSNVAAALGAGWLAQPPGLEAGEQREEIGYVVRRSKDNQDGSTTPVIDLYPANDAAKFAVLTVYLNTPEDVAAFQAASGLSLPAIPPYVGDNKIERGKKRELDRLVVKAPRAFGVVLIQNPKFDEREAEAARAANKMYTVPKRKFVRWADAKPIDKPAQRTEPTEPAEQGPSPDDQQPVEFDFLMDGVTLAGSQPSLAAAWNDVNLARARLTSAQLDALTRAKDVRKSELAGPQPAGQPIPW